MMMKMIKKWWYYLAVLAVLGIALATFGRPERPQPYKDYIFYGITQRINNGKLEVLYNTRSFPAHKHTVYVEVMDHHGNIDWLSTQEHTGTHKAHYRKEKNMTKPYKAFYDVSGLKPGKYKLRVTFDFKYGITGHINPVPYYSNWVKFSVK